MPFVASDGTRHDWLTVQSHITRILRRRFRSVDDEILADATQEALLDLMGYWQFLDSSSQAEGLRLSYALMRGCRFGASKVFAMVNQRRSEQPFPFRDGESDEDPFDAFEYALVDPDPTPEEVLEESDLTERARRMLDGLDRAELADWFNNLLTPETEREQAEREGVARNAIHERRSLRRTRAREGARKYGLVF